MTDDKIYRYCERPTTNHTTNSQMMGYTIKSTEDPDPSMYERYQQTFCTSRCCFNTEPDHMEMNPCINCPVEQFVEYMEQLNEE